MHYRDFYHPVRPPGSLPLWVVTGNCQAEALRSVLDAVPDRPYSTVRIPPVHELTRADLPFLDALLGQCSALLTQPIRQDYRDLPLGSGQLAARVPLRARTVRWPVIRYAGLHPFHVIVRDPADRSTVPPVAPYHDVRTLIAASAGREPEEPWDVDVTAESLRTVAETSRDELRAREARDTDVGISDVLHRHGVAAAHTINHPGNGVLVDLADRILEYLGVDVDVPAPQHVLLGSIRAPLEPRVLSANGLAAGDSRHDWAIDGQAVSPDRVHRAQLTWYRRNPQYLLLAARRHGKTLEQLGLTMARAS